MQTNLSSRILAALLFMTASASAGLLDGTAWEVQMKPTLQTAAKGAKPFEDVLTFSRCRLTSRELKRSGIGAVDYSAKGSKDFLNWETAPVLRERNKAEWDGVIKEETSMVRSSGSHAMVACSIII